MPPSPLEDRVVVTLSRPVRPQYLNLCLDSSYLGSATPGSSSHSPVIATTVVTLKAANLTYMPSSSGSARSLNCGCSSTSCCTVTTYDKDHQTQTQAIAAGPATTAIGTSTTCPANQMVNNNENTGSLSPSGGVGSPVTGTPKQLASIKIIYPNDLAKKMTKCSKSHLSSQGPVIIDCRPFMEYNKSHIQGAVHINCADKISRRRLQQGKITVLDLISCREGKDSFKRIFSKEIIVYDENTNEPSRVMPSQPLHIVLESLKREGKEPVVLKAFLGACGFKVLHGSGSSGHCYDGGNNMIFSCLLLQMRKYHLQQIPNSNSLSQLTKTFAGFYFFFPPVVELGLVKQQQQNKQTN
ncbi:Dusp10 [Phodopus roborovskii]|uniref:Dusp10 protein n=1 Tax=Phodopus roborovskii TaxID=109678 RepID=A0AAU9ZA64_PHORO|nr:Dusp10 [Phodopus roborovskii]